MGCEESEFRIVSRDMTRALYDALAHVSSRVRGLMRRTSRAERRIVPDMCEGPLGLSCLRDKLTCLSSPEIRASGRTGVRFRACESSRQGATATPTAVLLSSVRGPASTAGGSGPCLPERAAGGGVDGQGCASCLAQVAGQPTADAALSGAGVPGVLFDSMGSPSQSNK